MLSFTGQVTQMNDHAQTDLSSGCQRLECDVIIWRFWAAVANNVGGRPGRRDIINYCAFPDVRGVSPLRVVTKKINDDDEMMMTKFSLEMSGKDISNRNITMSNVKCQKHL